MHLLPLASALTLAFPTLILAAPPCLEWDGLFVALSTTSPCDFTLFINVDSETTAPCSGSGTTSPTGPWYGTCTAGHSIVVAPGGLSATYTNATGSYTRGQTLEDPTVFETCATTANAESSFHSYPVCTGQ